MERGGKNLLHRCYHLSCTPGRKQPPQCLIILEEMLRGIPGGFRQIVRSRSMRSVIRSSVPPIRTPRPLCRLIKESELEGEIGKQLRQAPVFGRSVKHASYTPSRHTF